MIIRTLFTDILTILKKWIVRSFILIKFYRPKLSYTASSEGTRTISLMPMLQNVRLRLAHLGTYGSIAPINIPSRIFSVESLGNGQKMIALVAI